jgi:hypothetical protein
MIAHLYKIGFNIAVLWPLPFLYFPYKYDGCYAAFLPATLPGNTF